MKKKGIGLLAAFMILAAVFLSFNGCSFRIQSAEKLLHPPKSDLELENALEDEVGTDIVYKSPQNAESEYRSAFTLYDIDGDGTEEAVVFYAFRSKEENVHMSVLKRNGDGVWTSIGDFDNYGGNVDTLSFVKLLDGSKTSEIVTTWSYVDSNVLTVHKYAGEYGKNSIKLLCNESYSHMNMLDIDSDGYFEFLLIGFGESSADLTPMAKVFKLVDMERIQNISFITLNRNVVNFESIQVSEATEDEPLYIFYDYTSNDGYIYTGVLYWDKHAKVLKSFVQDEKTQKAFATQRSVKILCSDVNNDQKIDLPIQEPIIGSQMIQAGKATGTLSYTKWSQVITDSKNLMTIKPHNIYSFYLSEKDYVSIHPAWIGKITVNQSTEQGTWDFFSYEKDMSSEQKLLAEVKSINTDNLEKYTSSGYTALSSNLTTKVSFVYRITDDGQRFGLKSSDFVNIK